MHRKSLILVALLLSLAVPMSASQFVDMAFDDVAREASLIVRGQVVDTWSAWNSSHDVIFTYATVRVSRYFGEVAGPDTVMVREVGGTVDGYTQEAIGFPAIRRGENVVLFLSQWEDSSDYRIHAYNQGKYLVRERGERLNIASEAALTIDEFATMVDDARAGVSGAAQRIRE